MQASEVKKALNNCANAKDAEFLQRFFKTYDGGYVAGDKFIGLRVPLTRQIAKEFRELPLIEIEKLLDSPIHEHRLAALVIMTLQFKKNSSVYQKQLYDLYLRRTDRINNWDLVDVSCRDIVGAYLINKPRDILYKLAKSKDIWERRIAIVSTWEFIRHEDLDDTFKISAVLLNDTHDLLHKAVGWMLREAGKKDEKPLLDFLDRHSAVMPRTMLRYSIEKLTPAQKLHYMNTKNSAKI